MYLDGHRIFYDKLPILSHNRIITPNCLHPYPRTEDGDIIFTRLHNHKDIEMLFIKSGTAHFVIDGISFEARSGDLVIVNPYELHYGTVNCSNQTFSFYRLTFDLSMLCAKAAQPIEYMCNALWEKTAKFENRISDSNEIVRIISELENKLESKSSAWEYYTYAYLFELFGFLINSDHFHNIASATKDAMFVKKVQEYVEKNFTENITSTDVAASLSYDNSYFCRLFRKNFGQTFGEYLNFHRINYAKVLLNEGCSVSKAAFSSGYNNTSYFIKQFKKYNTTSPSEYIRNQNGPRSQP